jgi:transcriptional regulator with XRE-family HTH domain
MNLRIAENIRRLRQEHNLTQVLLADRLGVSCQAVSRWENETTYPDIELLPTIAAFFGVTVDYLLGGTAEDQRRSLRQRWDQLAEITDPRDRVNHLRMMHREFPEDSYLTVRLCGEVPSLEEKRRLTREILQDCDVPYIRSMAIRQMIRSESEDSVMERMWEFNIPEECWDELLEDRYRTRGEADAYARKRQAVLLEALRKAMSRMAVGDTDCLPPCAEENEGGARTVLRMIAAMTGAPLSDLHPVAGEGEPDLWFSQRVWAGITLACALAAGGKGEEAMTVLEDAARLILRIRALPEDTVLSYATCGLESFDTTRGRLGGVCYRSDHMEAQFSHGSFDALRRDSRYAARFEACCTVFVQGGDRDGEGL